MRFQFPFYRQRDAMDCGPTCLMMVAAAHGREYPLTWLREQSHISREGVSAKGIMEAASKIGFHAMTVRVPFGTGEKTASLLSAPLPCIAHWNQNHFVVLYKTGKKHVWIADPSAGKFKLSRADFERSWCSDQNKGVLILLYPTPAFYDANRITVTKAGFSTILQYLRPYRRLIIQLAVGMIAGSLLMLIFPFLTQSIVDFGINNKNIGFVYMILGAQLILFLGQITIQFLQNRILLFIGARINVAMVSDFLAKLTRLPIGFFDSKMVGDLMQRIADQSRIESFLTNSTLSILFSTLNFMVFSTILLLYNTVIFGVFMCAAFLYITWILIFLSKRKELDYLRFQQYSENNNSLVELVQGMQEIKLQGSERKRRWIWAGIQAKVFYTDMRAMNIMQLQEAGAGFLNQTKNILITFLSATAVINGKMTLGMMLSTQYMIGMLDGPLQQFIIFIRASQDAKISLERMEEINEQPDEDTTNRSTFSPLINPVPSGDIILESVSFRYTALSAQVLKNITFCIPQGKVTAIVGASGSGKTTLLKLLLGFYHPVTGTIKIGAVSLSNLSPSVWRSQCGAVMQDGFFFSDTIANNIAESSDYPNIDRLNYAVAVANIAAFIKELPLGYNTIIGPKGNGISQGQRQRLLIARAIYKNPDYLFFDEATNALDANNEKTIVENLREFYRGNQDIPPKTVVVVAHRLSTVMHADQIIVLHQGEVVETGNHISLTRNKGFYYHLVKNQLELGI